MAREGEYMEHGIYKNIHRGGGSVLSPDLLFSPQTLFISSSGQYYYRPGLGLDDIQIQAALEYRPEVNINKGLD